MEEDLYQHFRMMRKVIRGAAGAAVVALGLLPVALLWKPDVGWALIGTLLLGIAYAGLLLWGAVHE